jgi:hypothetical protein
VIGHVFVFSPLLTVYHICHTVFLWLFSVHSRTVPTALTPSLLHHARSQHSRCVLIVIAFSYTLNAKACTVLELYGELDPETRDWHDGLLSRIFREACRPTDRNEKRCVQNSLPSCYSLQLSSTLFNSLLAPLERSPTSSLCSPISTPLSPIFTLSLLSSRFCQFHSLFALPSISFQLSFDSLSFNSPLINFRSTLF